jgi:hypothetical protein
MILHPHLKQLPIAVEVLQHMANVFKVYGLQPNEVRRIMADDEESDIRRKSGYLHMLATDNSQLDICYSLYSLSEYSPIFVKIELLFADNSDCIASRIVYVQYNCSLNEWVLGYEKNDEVEELLFSELADEFVKRFKLQFGGKRLLPSDQSWWVIREMVMLFVHLRNGVKSS